jgi:hypothetical protein
MPSYKDIINDKNQSDNSVINYHSIKNKISAALQARFNINFNEFNSCKRVYIKASLTIETAFSLSIFIFAAVLMLLPFRMMEAARRMQALCEAVNEEACKYAYVAYRIKNSGGLKSDSENDGSVYGESDSESSSSENAAYTNSEVFQSLLSSAAVGEFVKNKVISEVKDKHVQNISWLGTECMTQEDMILIKLTYSYKLPFALFNLGEIKQQVLSSRRAWIGSEGDKSDSENAENDTEDEVVYVGKTSTRYHRSRKCHYLYNDLKTVSKSEIANLRNASGGRYKPCARCGAAAGNTVYILPSGSSYHSTKNCTAINAYVRTVKKSEVEQLGECSYCGRRH